MVKILSLFLHCVFSSTVRQRVNLLEGAQRPQRCFFIDGSGVQATCGISRYVILDNATWASMDRADASDLSACRGTSIISISHSFATYLTNTTSRTICGDRFFGITPLFSDDMDQRFRAEHLPLVLSLRRGGRGRIPTASGGRASSS